MAIKYSLKNLESEFGILTFAGVLLSHRLSNELTQVEMANLLNISKQSLCDLEKGRRIPSPGRAAAIAKKLNMLPESFIELALQDQLRSENLSYIITLEKEIKKKAA